MHETPFYLKVKFCHNEIAYKSHLIIVEHSFLFFWLKYISLKFLLVPKLETEFDLELFL